MTSVQKHFQSDWNNLTDHLVAAETLEQFKINLMNFTAKLCNCATYKGLL